MMKAICYINQFFGQGGGETAADAAPIFHDGVVGCTAMIDSMVKPDIEVTHTIVCGDNYITNHTDDALKAIFQWLDGKKFDIFFAGPAFMAGRYGVGCGILTALIRLFGSLPEGVSFSIIIMNILVPHIERLTTPKPFGSAKTPKKKQSRKKEAGA